MTPEQITKALDRYIESLEKTRLWSVVEDNVHLTPERFPASGHNPRREEALRHALWMAVEAKKYVSAKPDKAMRWLCFIQGVLWSEGGYTIAEFREDNRGED